MTRKSLKNKIKDKVIPITLAALIALALINILMLGSATITLKGPDNLGLVASPNTMLGWNTTVAGNTTWLNFSANTTYNNSMVNITFPTGFTLNSTPLLNYNVFTSGFTNVSASNITTVGQVLQIYNSTGNITANGSLYGGIFWINLSVGSTGALTAINQTNFTHEINMGGNWSDTYNPSVGSDVVNTTYLTVYNMTQDDTATITPSIMVPGTVRNYNFTITNTNSGLSEIYSKVKIEMPSGYTFLGNKYSVKSNASGFDYANVTTTTSYIEITGLTFLVDSSIYVNIDDIKTGTGTGVFPISMYNATTNVYGAISQPPSLSIVSAPTADRLVVKTLTNVTVANAATVYVQAQNDTSLANTTNIKVLLKSSSSNAFFPNGYDNITLSLVNGNASTTINTTTAGTYTLNAYDMNNTANPLTKGSDSITFIPGAISKLGFNVTSPVNATINTNLTINVSLMDVWSNINTTASRSDVLVQLNPAKHAKLIRVGSTDMPTGTISNVTTISNGNQTLVIRDSTVEDGVVLMASTYSSPLLTSTSVTINFQTAAAGSFKVTPTTDTNITVGSIVQIAAQLIDAGENNVTTPNVTVRFSLQGNITSTGFVNGTLSTYTNLTDSNGIARTTLTLPTQDGLIVNITANATINDSIVVGTSKNYTTINDTISQMSLTYNTTTENDNITGFTDGGAKKLNLTLTLQDQYGNTAEEARLVNYSISSYTTTVTPVLSKINGTTQNGVDSLDIRAFYPGSATITANSTGLPNKTYTVWFYGNATKIKAIPQLSTFTANGTNLSVAIKALDINDLVDEDFSTNNTINVTVSGSAIVGTSTNTTLLWNNSDWSEIAINLTYKGNGSINISDTKAETVYINVTSSGLTSVNATVVFYPMTTITWLNASATPNSTTMGGTLNVTIVSKDANNNTVSYPLLPVTIRVNDTSIATITSTSGLSQPNITADGSTVTGLLNGSANVELTGKPAKTGYVDVEPSTPVPGVTGTNATVRFTSANYTQVNITTNRLAIVGNGTDSATITATLKDVYGNTVETSGIVIDLNTTFGTLTQTSNTTSTSGTVTATLKSSDFGNATVYATTTDPLITKINNASVRFVGEPFKFTLTPSKTSATVNEVVNLVVQVVDYNGSSVSFVKDFNLTTNLGTLTNSTGGTGSTAGLNQFTNLYNGTSNFTITSATAGIATISMNTSSGLTLPSNVNITFEAVTTQNFSISLSIGWNLISTPLTPTNNSLDNITASIANDIDPSSGIWAYDRATKTWTSYQPGAPGNTLTTMSPQYGYWIKMANASTLNITGTFLEPGAFKLPPTYNVVTGWNLIGFHSQTNINASDYLRNLGSDGWSSMYRYNNDTAGYTKILSNDQMWRGYGYWLYATQNGTIAI